MEEMEDELTSVSRAQADLEQQVADSRAKAAAVASELSAERKRSGKTSAVLSRMTKDWSELGSTKDTRQLKEAASRLYKKYCNNSEPADKDKEEDEGKEETAAALEEIMRQKSFLERTVSSLKAQMAKRELVQKQEYLRKMRENQFLIKEVETLKAELKAARGYRVTPRSTAVARMTVTRSTSTEDEEDDGSSLGDWRGNI
jgi:hypothetical protein